MTRAALEKVPAGELVRAAGEIGAVVAAKDDPALLMMPVVDGGLLPTAPEEAVAVRIGILRPAADRHHPGRVGLLHRRGPRPQLPGRRRVAAVDGAPDHGGRSGDQLIASVRAARSARGEPVSPRDLWVAISHRVRVPTADGPVRRRPRRCGGARCGHLLLPVHVGVAGIRGGARLVPRPGHPVRVRDGPQPGGADVLGWRRRRIRPFRRRTPGLDRDSPAPVPRGRGPVGRRDPADHGARALARPGGDWSTGSTGRGTRSSRPWRSSSPPVRASEPGRAPEPATGADQHLRFASGVTPWAAWLARVGGLTPRLRGRSPTGRGRALKPPPVRVRLPPSPPDRGQGSAIL